MDGLLITLKKRRLNAEDKDDNGISFFVWGYFDIAHIEKMKKWSDFIPTNTVTAEESIYSNEFQIKLVNPTNFEELEKKTNLINYLHDDINNPIFEKLPLLSICILQFTEKAFLSFSVDQLAEIISDTIVALSEDMQNEGFKEDDLPVFAVYPSIGYMDMVILFRSNNFASVSKIIYTLRAKQNFLTSSYTLPCINFRTNENGLKAWQGCTKDDITRLSIRGTLKPGKSTKSFFNEYKQDVTSGSNDDIYYEMYGNSDILILPDTPASSLATLYLGNGNLLMQPPFRNLLSTTRGSIRVLSKEGTPAADHFEIFEGDPDITDGDIAVRRDYEKAIRHQLLSNIDNKGNRIMTDRLGSGLFTLLNFYFDITNHPHTFGIRAMMDPVIDSFIKNLELSGTYYGEDINKESILIKICDAASMFKSSFHSVIRDISRAERHLFEGRWLRHPAVGSSTKIIMLFHAFVVRIVSLFESENGESKYTFLTTSADEDYVRADLLFKFLTPQQDEHGNRIENRLIILRIAEALLFQLPKTMFFVAHELFHYVGPRQREKRHTAILKSLSRFVALSFTKEFDARYVSSMLSKVLDNQYKLMVMKNIFGKVKNESFDKIHNACFNSWDQLISPSSADLNQWEYHALDGIENSLGADELISSEKTPSPLVKTLREINEEHFAKYLIAYQHIAINERFPDNKPILQEDCEAIKQNSSVNSLIKDIIARTDHHLNWLSGHSDYDGAPEQSGFFTMGMMYDIIIEAFRESFADMCSITLLGTSPIEYFKLFFDDTTNKKQLSNRYAAALRVGSVLSVCYQKEFKDLLSDFPTNGLWGDYLTFLIDLLNNYDKVKQIAEPLESYLDVCKEDLEKSLKAHSGRLSPYLDICRDARKTEIENKTVIKILSQWRDIAC